MRSQVNQDLRECFFRFCSEHQLTSYSTREWLALGHYRRVAKAIEAIGFCLTPEAVTLLELLLDPSPSVSPVSQSKKAPRWIRHPGAESSTLEALENELSRTDQQFK
jgi:hypothetical protein